MKKFLLLSVFCFIIATASLMAQIKVATNGNVGINNTSPAYKLDIGGNMRATASGSSMIFDGTMLYPATTGS